MNAMLSAAQDGDGAVALPSEWHRQLKARPGDSLAASAVLEDGSPAFARSGKAAAAKQLMETVDSLPNVPWLNGDTPDDDRELLSRRFS